MNLINEIAPLVAVSPCRWAPFSTQIESEPQKNA